MKTVRRYCLRFHRWFGLSSAAFLILVGLTGSVLAFYDELDAWVNPQFSVPAQPGRPFMDLAMLAEQAQALAPEMQILEATLRNEGRQAEIRTRPRLGAAPTVAPHFDSILLNPYTGVELGRRTWGDISQGRVNLIPFIYRLHYELALGHWGMLLLGVIAVGWTLDCFGSLILTLPLSHRRPISIGSISDRVTQTKQRGFWFRWKTAWTIKHPASAIRRIFDLHRAVSLWLWLVLLVFAWSSVYLTLPQTIYAPVMRMLSDYPPSTTPIAKALDTPSERPEISWSTALARARSLMAHEALPRGITINDEVMLRFVPEERAWLYRTHTSRDVLQRRGATDLIFDADTGAFRSLKFPTGEQSGSTLTSWLYALHVANIWGTPWRIVVAIMGGVLSALAATGVLIWIRKRRSRRHLAQYRSCRNNFR